MGFAKTFFAVFFGVIAALEFRSFVVAIPSTIFFLFYAIVSSFVEIYNYLLDAGKDLINFPTENMVSFGVVAFIAVGSFLITLFIVKSSEMYPPKD